MFNFYVYVMLNPLKPGIYSYGKLIFDYEPFYIGKGKENRMNEHCYDSQMKRDHNKLKINIINKIRKNGKEPIVNILYDNISENSAFRLECLLIEKIGRRNLKLGTLANLTNGGEGASGKIYTTDERKSRLINKQKIVQYDNEGTIIKIWNDIIDICIEMPHIRGNNIHRACRSNQNRKMDNYFWKYYENEKLTDKIKIKDKNRKILQYDLNGNFLKEWHDRVDLWQNGFNGYCCLQCCINNRKKESSYEFYKYIWIFKEDEIQNIIKPYYNPTKIDLINKNVILQYDSNNNLIKEWTARELKDAGYLAKTIYRCCRGELKKTQGFVWRYKD